MLRTEKLKAEMGWVSDAGIIIGIFGGVLARCVFDGWEDAEDRFVEIGEGKDELVFDFGFEGEVLDTCEGAEQF